MHRRVAGLDVHKQTVVACVRLMAGHRATRECRTFATTTEALVELLSWLAASQVTHVAMEATGVYWTPVWKILSEGDFELIVANAAHIKQVPGRKTDMNDAMWIADLLACGLLKASFVPPEEIQELRSLMRTRKQLVREQTRHVQRIEKTLEEANIKLGTVLSDLMGASGRRMIEAMIAGERDPHRLAALAERSVKASPKALHDALHGRLREQHRFLLQLRSTPICPSWCRRSAGARPYDRGAHGIMLPRRGVGVVPRSRAWRAGPPDAWLWLRVCGGRSSCAWRVWRPRHIARAWS
jgi:transposase